jgi:8-oxo-dGTP pyrophosphatase MutT (NUDIX family)
MTYEKGLACLSKKEDFLALVVEKLARRTIDYSEIIRFVHGTRTATEPHSAAGVLLLLHFRSNDPVSDHNNGEFIFQLIKRSAKVTQPGDLGCPGGLLHSFLDPLLRPLISCRLIPILQGNALKYTLMKDRTTSRAITLFLTNAVREAWEETGLKPWNILFLGPLPSYSLLLFKRIIFPLVGFVKREWHFHPNSEVEKIIEIPLTTFFDERNYGLYRIQPSNDLGAGRKDYREFPCLIIHDTEGKEEILWGATFFIIIDFLKIVLDFELPDMHEKRVIKRILGPEYLTGHPK